MIISKSIAEPKKLPELPEFGENIRYDYKSPSSHY